MEFGKLDDLSNVDWSLPPVSLGDNASTAAPQILLGSPAWGNKFFVDKIYPKDARPEEYLMHYARHYDVIELNTSHYRIPAKSTVDEWRSQVPPEFLFCPKVFKGISHERTGLLDTQLHQAWFEFLSSLENHLGPSFIQFSEHFSYENRVLLFKFLESWPREFALSLELRHSSWYKNRRVLPALVDYLKKKNIGLVTTDTAGRRDIVHTDLTSDWAMIRLIGNDLHPSDEVRLKNWIEVFKSWRVERIFLFLHQYEDIKTAEFSLSAKTILESQGFPIRGEFSLPKNPDLLSLISSD